MSYAVMSESYTCYISLSGPEGLPAAEERAVLGRAVCCSGARERPLSAGDEHILAPRASHGGDRHRASLGGASVQNAPAMAATTPTDASYANEVPHGRVGSASCRAPRSALGPRAAAACQRAEQRRQTTLPAPSGSPQPKPPKSPSAEAAITSPADSSGARVGWRVSWRGMRRRGSSGREPRSEAKVVEEEEESGSGRHSRCFRRLHLDLLL